MDCAKNLRLIMNTWSEKATTYLFINDLKLSVGKKVIAVITSLV